MDQKKECLLEGKNETTDEFFLLTSRGALTRRVLMRLPGKEILGQRIPERAGGQFVSARPRDEWLAVLSRRNVPQTTHS